MEAAEYVSVTNEICNEEDIDEDINAEKYAED